MKHLKFLLILVLCLAILPFFRPLAAHATELPDPVASLTVGETVTEHASLAEAIAAANNASGSCTIRLLRDTAETNGSEDKLFFTGKSGTLTIDFGSHTLTCDILKSGTGSSIKLTGTTGGVSGSISFYGPGCSIDGGVYHGTVTAWLVGEVTVNGGTFTSDGKLLLADGADITVNNGTFTGADGLRVTDSFGTITVKGGSFAVTNGANALLSADAGGYLRVSGGTFSAATDVNADSTARVLLEGGVFSGGIRSSGAALESLLRKADYNLNCQYLSDGTPISLSAGQTEITGCDVKVANVIALVNGTYYSSFGDAAAAFAGGGTFTLLTNCQEWLPDLGNWITVSGGGTFDLNGYTLKASGGSSVLCIQAGSAPLTVKDSSAAGTGRITGASYSILHSGSGNVTVESGTYVNFGRIGDGSLIINGGTFESSIFANTDSEDAKVILNGGTFLQGLWCTSGKNQNIRELLGDGKTYQVGELIWSSFSLNALGDQYEFERGNSVTVVNESDAVATFTKYTSLGELSEERHYPSLSAAISANTTDSLSHITLRKDSAEDVTLSSDCHFVFLGKATGVFTLEDGCSVYLNAPLPDGMKLRIKMTSYSDDPFESQVLRVLSGADFTVSTDDVEAEEEGVTVVAYSPLAISLIHEHSWSYTLTEADGSQSIAAACAHPDVCWLDADTPSATASLTDTVWSYDGDPHSCSASLSYTSDYNGAYAGMPQYFDSDGNLLTDQPADSGTYTARLTFGDKTAEATLRIDPIAPQPSQFSFIAPIACYDGTPKPAVAEVNSDVTGMGSVTLCYYDSNGTLLDGAPVDAGTYTVKLSISAGRNYTAAELSDTAWICAVDPKPITVTADDGSKLYGAEDPALTATVQGLVGGEMLTVPLTRSEGENAGTYEINLAVPAEELSKNYTISFTAGTFTVEPKPVDASVLLSKELFVYDGSEFEPTVTAKDGNTVIPASEYTVKYKHNKRPGTATVTLTDNEGGNYIVTGSATFTIARAEQTTAPVTGDRSNLLLWAMLLPMSCAGCCLLFRRKKAEEQH